MINTLNSANDAHHTAVLSAMSYNRTLIFNALRSENVTRVVITYDGYGDSGGIEACDVTGGAGQASLTARLQAQEACWGQADHTVRDLSVREVMEGMAMSLVNDHHGGWENNEGGSGRVIFDVPTAAITVEHTENVMSYEDYIHHC